MGFKAPSNPSHSVKLLIYRNYQQLFIFLMLSYKHLFERGYPACTTLFLITEYFGTQQNYTLLLEEGLKQ